MLTGGGFLVGFPTGIHDDEGNLIGTRVGIMQGCFGTEDFVPGLYRATIAIERLTSEQYSWAFYVGGITIETKESELATLTMLPTMTPLAIRSVNIQIEPTDRTAASTNHSLFDLTATFGDKREKLTLKTNAGHFWEPGDIRLMYVNVKVFVDGEILPQSSLGRYWNYGVMVDNYDTNGELLGSYFNGTMNIGFDTYNIPIGTHTLLVRVTTSSGKVYDASWKFTIIENSE